MSHGTIDRLIINSPYTEPKQHWRYNRTTRSFELLPGRRPAGYIVASESAQSFDDPGTFIEIPLVNLIRERVRAWRDQGLPRYHRDHPPPPRPLEKPRRTDGYRILLLPGRSNRNAHLDCRSAGLRKDRHRGIVRRRRVRPGLLQDGNRHRQDRRHGHAHRMAGPEQDDVPERSTILAERPHRRPGTYRKEPAFGTRPVQ